MVVVKAAEAGCVKIVMLMSVYGTNALGGAERQAAVMAANLAHRGHTTEIISLGPYEKGAARKLDAYGQLVTHIPLTQVYDPYGLNGVHATVSRSAVKRALWHGVDVFNPWMVHKVSRELEISKPDVLFTHTLQGFSVGVWGAAQNLGIKVVHMVHDHALICPNTAMTRGQRICERPCLSCNMFSAARRAVASTPDAVVGPSQNVLDRHRQFGWFKDVALQFVVPNALPAMWPSAPAQLPQQTTGRALIFGFLGRIDLTKGADTLISAAARFDSAQCRVRLAGVGDGNALKGNLEFAPDMLEFCGPVNAAEFLQSIDVLVAVSRAPETFCNVVMEAGSLGVPAIVSDRGALPERVLNGSAGWIVPAGDADALFKVMAHCINNPDEVISKAKVSMEMRSLHSSPTQTDRIERLLMQVVDNKAARES
jgi:glycosyltransferase involved in cell wall biosynthesis